MRYRKGEKGLYYEDDRLYQCDYNHYNAPIWYHYIWALQNISWDQLVDAFKIIFTALLLIPMLPFCGIIHKIIKRRNIEDNTNFKKSNFNQIFPKDYYEELR